MLADIALRRRDYAEPDLFTARGRYGDIRWLPVLTVVVATGLGWGLVTNGLASWLTWQGYLLGPFGLGGKTGAWAFANLGVLIALALGFIVTFAVQPSRRPRRGSRPAARPGRRLEVTGISTRGCPAVSLTGWGCRRRAGTRWCARPASRLAAAGGAASSGGCSGC